MIQALVLTCMDYRFVSKVHTALANEGYYENYDFFAAAGSSLMYTHDKTDSSMDDSFTTWRNMFEKHIDLAIALHDIKELIIFEHEDCGAYNHYYRKAYSDDTNPDMVHRLNFNFLKKHLSDEYPNLNIIGYKIYLNGSTMKYQ